MSAAELSWEEYKTIWYTQKMNEATVFSEKANYANAAGIKTSDLMSQMFLSE